MLLTNTTLTELKYVTDYISYVQSFFFASLSFSFFLFRPCLFSTDQTKRNSGLKAIILAQMEHHVWSRVYAVIRLWQLSSKFFLLPNHFWSVTCDSFGVIIVRGIVLSYFASQLSLPVKKIENKSNAEVLSILRRFAEDPSFELRSIASALSEEEEDASDTESFLIQESSNFFCCVQEWEELSLGKKISARLTFNQQQECSSVQSSSLT